VRWCSVHRVPSHQRSRDESCGSVNQPGGGETGAVMKRVCQTGSRRARGNQTEEPPGQRKSKRREGRPLVCDHIFDVEVVVASRTPPLPAPGWRLRRLAYADKAGNDHRHYRASMHWA
jgi:hypothetical protein